MIPFDPQVTKIDGEWIVLKLKQLILNRRAPQSTSARRVQTAEVYNFDAWFSGKEFTSDWVSKKLPSWQVALEPFRDSAGPVSVLEIGTYEGRSAVAFLEMLPNSRIVAVDFFPQPEVELRFDRNLASYGDRCQKIKGRAINVMDSFVSENLRFDVIYLDGGKIRDDTFAQSALAWSLLNQGGVLIWDDLRWKLDKPTRERPAQAIELFAQTFSSCIDVIYRGQQLIVRKTGDWPK